MLEIWFNYSNKCSIYHHEFLCPAFYMERKVAVISQCSKNVLHLKWNNIASRNFNISQVKGHNNVTNNLCYLFIYLFVYLFIHSFFFIIYLSIYLKREVVKKLVTHIWRKEMFLIIIVHVIEIVFRKSFKYSS